MADHLDHDVERLVDYADDELDADARLAVERQITGCPDCTRLVADLRAVAMAHAAAPVPARSRDFRLTSADAARLQATPEHAEHAGHDPMLVAAATDEDLSPAARERVASWLATCGACASLRDDILAISAANRVLWTPPRVRDFRLDEATAAGLSRRGWRGLMRWIGSSGDTLTRPLAVGLTTLGIAGLLLSSGNALLSVGTWASGGVILSAVGAPIEPESAGQAAQAGQAAPSVLSDRNVFSGQGEAPVAAASAASAASAAPSAAPAPAAAALPLASAAAAVPAASAAASVAAPAPTDVAALTAPSGASSDGGGVMSQIDAASPNDDAARTAASDENPGRLPPLALASVILLIAGVALFGIRRIRGHTPT